MSKKEVLFDSHPLMDCQDSPNVNYGEPKPKEDNTELIEKVVSKTAAFMAGGIKMQVEKENKRVILYSNGCFDFMAVGIFDSLGIFDVVISSDRKQRVLIVVS